MKIKPKTIIFGGSGFIGSFLRKVLNANSEEYLWTSRNRKITQSTEIFYELQNEIFPKIPDTINRAIICLPAGGFKNFSKNFEQISRQMNILFDQAVSRKLQITYVSSNAVFSDNFLNKQVFAERQPRSYYGEFKMQTENFLLNLLQRNDNQNILQIIRLTKILDVKKPPLSLWLEDLTNSIKVEVLSDKYLSPISIRFAANGIYRISKSSNSGVFHLSGIETLNYLRLMELICDKLKIDKSLLVSASESKRFNQINKSLKFETLDMTSTSEAFTNLDPLSTADFVEEIAKSYIFDAT